MNVWSNDTDVTARGNWFQFLLTLLTKLLRLLRVPLLYWSKLREGPLKPGLLENLNSSRRNKIVGNLYWLL